MAQRRHRVGDIVAQSGLSRATVDRVLHDRPGVRASTVAQVRRAIEELDRQREQVLLSTRPLLLDLVVQAPQRFSAASRQALEDELQALRPAVVRVRSHLDERSDPEAAAREFAQAYTLFRQQFGVEDVRTAQAGVHLAALAVEIGQYDTAITLADRHLRAARQAQNAILVAGLLSVKAEALAGLGQAEAAQETRLDSLRWARYGFGDADGALAREQAQLAALLRLENE